MVMAFFATLTLGVQTGVLVATGFSVVLFLSSATRSKIVELGRIHGTLRH